MRVCAFLMCLLLITSPVVAAEPIADDDKFYDSSEAASDSEEVTESGNILRTQPGLRECSVDTDCTMIEGVCEDWEPANIQRAAAKQEANRKARAVVECMPIQQDRTFIPVKADCVENECVIQKKRR